MITFVPIAFYETLCAIKTKTCRTLIQLALTSYSERGLPRKFPFKSKTFLAMSKVANDFMS
jgi:hypothetical protein